MTTSNSPIDASPLTDFGAVPSDWLWGVATAAHQIEGGNVNNDWWHFEHTPGSGVVESSGDACDSWNRWREDLQLVKDLGLDAYRFSLEWSRIEPAEGEFSLVALNHYREQMVAARELGLKNAVTFHHFTTPQWAAVRGGWTNPQIVDWFARYVDIAAKHLGDLIDVAATLNEPNVVALNGYLSGEFPPGHKDDMAGAQAATTHFVQAHHQAREVLKAAPGDFPVGLTLAIVDFVIHEDGTLDSEGVHLTDATVEGPAAEFAYLFGGAYLEAARSDDFIGVQTYNTEHMDGQFRAIPRPEGTRVTQMNWTFTPEALGRTVRAAAKHAGVPIIVTENGVAAADDAERVEYYSRSLRALRSAMDDGADVRGFFAWSLLDNFEWAHGYAPTFGLVAVDPVIFAREPKPSAHWYANLVARSRQAG